MATLRAAPRQPPRDNPAASAAFGALRTRPAPYPPPRSRLPLASPGQRAVFSSSRLRRGSLRVCAPHRSWLRTGFPFPSRSLRWKERILQLASSPGPPSHGTHCLCGGIPGRPPVLAPARPRPSSGAAGRLGSRADRSASCGRGPLSRRCSSGAARGPRALVRARAPGGSRTPSDPCSLSRPRGPWPWLFRASDPSEPSPFLDPGRV